MVRLVGIFVYPVKSCGALAHDRRWVVVDPAGEFLTQRTLPELATVRPRLASDGITLAVPGREDLPLRAGRERVSVRVWGDEVDALAGDAASEAWISAALGRPARLACMDERSARRARGADGREYPLSFADAQPLLVVGQASLDELNRSLERPVQIDRFRPNVVFDGAPPRAEDGWRRVRVGALELEAVTRCVRCVVTTIDQATAEPDADREPLRTLARLRPAGDGERGPAHLGLRVAPRASGVLSVGDELEVLERGEAPHG